MKRFRFFSSSWRHFERRGPGMWGGAPGVGGPRAAVTACATCSGEGSDTSAKTLPVYLSRNWNTGCALRPFTVDERKGRRKRCVFGKRRTVLLRLLRGTHGIGSLLVPAFLKAREQPRI